ncbi:hypothetical protein AK830_g87 [Neonectria ditissima]|uniref:Uncharacterized protein n=1 Tax=Neonectria ditissima TaxID=78410 RepID=A0A0P7BH96_9HYPO|nr:hypothetical protein AK830_g87 [Neonectria ditissima]
MLPIANAIPVGPKVLPVVLAVGGATIAGGYLPSQSRAFGRRYNTAQSEPVQAKSLERSGLESRSKYFNSVLESIFA